MMQIVSFILLTASLLSFAPYRQDNISLPLVDPTPQKVMYSDNMVELSGFKMVDKRNESKDDGRILLEIKDIETELGLKGPEGNADLILNLTAEKESTLGKEGYELRIFPDQGRLTIACTAVTDHGLFYGLQSLAQLCVRRGGQCLVRPAEITDFPNFIHRGMIVGDTSMESLQFMRRYKLNCVMNSITRDSKDLSGVNKIVEQCQRYFIEFIALEGYKDMLTGNTDIAGYYRKRCDLGVRTITVNFDDLSIAKGQGKAMAQKHLDIAMKAYKTVTDVNKEARIIFCPTPYGGTPDKRFIFTKDINDAVDYLKLVGEQLPEDVDIFWTGDDVFATNMDASMADSFGKLIRRKPFIWENMSIRWCNGFQPLSKRSADLYKHSAGFLANVNEGETKDILLARPVWITMADYLWNSEVYDSKTALDHAFQSLATDGWGEISTAWKAMAKRENKIAAKSLEPLLPNIRNEKFRDHFQKKLREWPYKN